MFSKIMQVLITLMLAASIYLQLQVLVQTSLTNEAIYHLFIKPLAEQSNGRTSQRGNKNRGRHNNHGTDGDSRTTT